MSTWINLPEELDREKHFAIIYKITNLTTNYKYIGKKQLWVKKTKPPLKGKKRKRKEWVKSDYETYFGSSEQLKADILKYGKENFKREILEIASCKWDAAYIELYFQLTENVLMNDNYYNGIINVRLPKPPKSLVLSTKYLYNEK
jgi:predicted glycosyl hydrolase (DUF1957 family)